MVHYAVAGLQEAFQQVQYYTETSAVVQAPVDHVANAVQNTQQHLATQMQQMQAMMQDIQIQYATAPPGTRQDYGGLQDYGRQGYHGNQSSYRGWGGRGAKKKWIGAEALAVEPTVILHITVGHT